MACQLGGGSGLPPAYATVHLNPDGTAVLRCGTQDIGTGTRTVLAQIVAEELGLEIGDVRVELGDTNSQYAPISAGSLTVSSVGPAVPPPAPGGLPEPPRAPAPTRPGRPAGPPPQRGAVLAK